LGLLALFFWGHFLAGLTGWEDIALGIVGLVLIAIEIIVVPGFGIPGVLGLAAVLGGLFLAMLGRDVQTPDGIEQAGVTILVSFIAIVFGLVALVTLLSRGRRFNRLVLQSAVGGREVGSRPVKAPWLTWFGATAQLPREDQPHVPSAPKLEVPHPNDPRRAGDVALSDLRPSGVASISGQRVDVVTEGDHIAAGEAIEVVVDEGYRRVVRRVPS
jgi:membrane-bound serine protease (ClpP class)